MCMADVWALPWAASLASCAHNEDGQTTPAADPRQHYQDSAPLRMRVQGQLKGPCSCSTDCRERGCGGQRVS